MVNTNNIVQKYLSKQTDIDKILKNIQRKVLKGTHLPVTIKGIQAGYLNSPYFKHLYLYLTQNRLPSSKNTICKVEVLAEIHIRLIAIQTGHNSREGNCTISNTRSVCTQDNYTLPFKSVCGTPRCNKDIPNNSQQILYTRPCALFLHKGLSHMSTL